jgi:hypothetical protein
VRQTCFGKGACKTEAMQQPKGRRQQPGSAHPYSQGQFMGKIEDAQRNGSLRGWRRWGYIGKGCQGQRDAVPCGEATDGGQQLSPGSQEATSHHQQHEPSHEQQVIDTREDMAYSQHAIGPPYRHASGSAGQAQANAGGLQQRRESSAVGIAHLHGPLRHSTGRPPAHHHSTAEAMGTAPGLLDMPELLICRYLHRSSNLTTTLELIPEPTGACLQRGLPAQQY